MTAAPVIITESKVDSPGVCRALARVAEAARVRRCRTMLQFAAQEIVLPTGPYAGERFRPDRQPWSALWIGAQDSNQWRRSNLTGPSQAGKTLIGSTLPVVYHLFEHVETIIYAAPTIEMAADKWTQDILPIIEASAYRDLLPHRGGSSKGGTAISIQFRHGPTLRFMSGGGSDKVRAGFTSRVAIITETDGLDETSANSREADKISQIEARTNAFRDRARIYLECTVSTDAGRTWQELKQGTDSRLSLPCPHCGKWVTLEREHLTGWQDAANVAEAGQRSAFCCMLCGVVWSDADRTGANRRAKLIHKGQSVDESGTIVGLIPPTNTLSLRFSAANNLLTTAARIGEEEWTAQRFGDAALNEKKLRQFWWALPSEAEGITLTELDAMAICRRVVDVPRGRVPVGSVRMTIGVDIGKWLCHWVAVSWTADGTPHVVEYGRLEVASQAMAEEVAILTALRRFRDEICIPGWPSMSADAPNTRPSLVLVDSGNWESVVVAFTRESGNGFLPAKGFGVAQVGRRKSMHEPGYEPIAQPGGYVLVEINSDVWKSYVHARLQTPPGQPGGISLFHATPTDHLSFSKHLTAEKRVEEFIAGRGLVSRWEAISRNNHFLDALALACVGGHGVGIRMVQSVGPAPQPSATQPGSPDRPDWIPDTPQNWLNR